MPPNPPAANTPAAAGVATALAIGRARRRRPWSPSARASCGGPPGSSIEERPAVTGPYFLVIDDRYGTPIYVFLELDPAEEPSFPAFGILAVTLEPAAGLHGMGLPAGAAIGRDPHHLDRFRAFGSDRAVAGAGFILIEPRYVGPSWAAYALVFRPGGE